jgi:hypothetical protein
MAQSYEEEDVMALAIEPLKELSVSSSVSGA